MNLNSWHYGKVFNLSSKDYRRFPFPSLNQSISMKGAFASVSNSSPQTKSIEGSRYSHKIDLFSAQVSKNITSY